MQLANEVNQITRSFEGDLEKIEGLTFRMSDDTIVSTPDRPLIRDLNTLPIPNRSYIDVESYKKINSLSMPYAKKTPVATIMTSRGCPYDCVFCSTKVMWKRDWRSPETEKVIEEIEYLVNTFGYKEIAIVDDQFILSKQRVAEICDALLEKNIDISLTVPSGTSIWLVDFPLLKKMREAGFYRLCFPIETGNETTLKFVNKPVNLKKVKKTIEYTTQLGYWTQGNFIIGFPYETREEILETIRYAYDSGLDYAFFFVAKPHAGAEMYEVFEKEGLLNQDIARSKEIEESAYDTTTMTANELNQIQKQAVKGFLAHKLKFYLTPSTFINYLLPKLRSIDDIKYAFKIFRVLINQKILPLVKPN